MFQDGDGEVRFAHARNADEQKAALDQGIIVCKGLRLPLRKLQTVIQSVKPFKTAFTIPAGDARVIQPPAFIAGLLAALANINGANALFFNRAPTRPVAQWAL